MDALLVAGWVIFAGNCLLWCVAELRRLRRCGRLAQGIGYVVASFSLQLVSGVAAVLSGSALLTLLFFAWTIAGPLTVFKAWSDVRRRRRMPSG